MTASREPCIEGLSAKHQIAVGGLFLNGHAIEVGTLYSGVLTENKQPGMSGLPGFSTGAGYTLSYDAQDEAHSFSGKKYTEGLAANCVGFLGTMLSEGLA